jgi:hypothetical protein
MSARQTVLHTKKRYGRIIFAPLPPKKKEINTIQQTWKPHAILVSDWSISKKISPLKLLIAI